MRWSYPNMPVAARPGTGQAPDDGEGTGAVLTPAEARQLAAALLRQAAAAEHPDSDAGRPRRGPPAVHVRQPSRRHAAG